MIKGGKGGSKTTTSGLRFESRVAMKKLFASLLNYKVKGDIVYFKSEYDSISACDDHKDCLFLRQGGCAVTLGAKIAESNSKAIQQMQTRLDGIEQELIRLNNKITVTKI